jgi:PAS domain S-box-containing protein
MPSTTKEHKPEIQRTMPALPAVFEAIYRDAPIGIEVFDNNGRLVDANRWCLEIFGVRDLEFIKDFRLFDDPNISAADLNLLKQGKRIQYRRTFDFAKVRAFELYPTSKSGTIHLDVLIEPIRDTPEGEITGYVAVVQDCTVQVKREEELRTAEERWKFAFEGAGDGVWDWDATTNVVFFSSQWKAMLGYADDEIGTGLDEWESRVHPDDLARVKAEIEKHFRGETPYYASEHRVRCKDGSYKWILDRGKIMTRSADGLPQRVVGTHTDISGRVTAEEQLRESEQNIRTLFDSLDHLVFILDMTGRMLYTNEAVTRRLGFSRDELRGQNVLMLHPAERRKEATSVLMAILNGSADSCPVPVVTRSGRLIPVETRITRGRWSHQDVLFGVSKDLSELKASEEKFLAAFKSSPTLMAITEVQTGRYHEVNDMFCRITGYSRGEIIGRTALELNLFAAPEQRTDAMRLITEQGYLRDFEAELRTRSGEIRFGLFSMEFVRLQDRQLMLTVMNDITARRKAEEEIVEGAQQLNTVIETIGEGISVSDKGGYFELFNSTLTTITGYTRDEANAETDFTARLYPGLEDRQVALDGLKVLLETGRTHEVETTITCKDGSIKTVLVSSSVIRYKHEQMFLSAWRDITERKRIETEKETLLRDLQHALAEVKTLSGLLPICSHCKKVRDDSGYWNQIESYIISRSEVVFSHGVCPDCMKTLYPFVPPIRE